jgi:hypothetical protein
MADYHWTCPYCNRNATLTDNNISRDTHYFTRDNKDGSLALRTEVYVCPNSKCKEYVLVAILLKEVVSGQSRVYSETLQIWQLRPESSAKPLPSYIPQAIKEDYEEACLIVSKSPKASATLSRRCLQGMIRDFWKISKPKLVQEINELKELIDIETWEAIDAVRSVGNIGAHMEMDINLIVEVEPKEAQLLIGLIETLVEDWYVHRFDRQERKRKVIEMAADKKKAKVVPHPSSDAAGQA